MSTVVRRCTKCGQLDLRHRWSSLSAAADEGALNPDWACSNCAWPEAELIEVDGSEDQESGVQEQVAQSSKRG